MKNRMPPHLGAIFFALMGLWTLPVFAEDRPLSGCTDYPLSDPKAGTDYVTKDPWLLVEPRKAAAYFTISREEMTPEILKHSSYAFIPSGLQVNNSHSYDLKNSTIMPSGTSLHIVKAFETRCSALMHTFAIGSKPGGSFYSFADKEGHAILISLSSLAYDGRPEASGNIDLTYHSIITFLSQDKVKPSDKADYQVDLTKSEIAADGGSPYVRYGHDGKLYRIEEFNTLKDFSGMLDPLKKFLADRNIPITHTMLPGWPNVTVRADLGQIEEVISNKFNLGIQSITGPVVYVDPKKLGDVR